MTESDKAPEKPAPSQPIPHNPAKAGAPASQPKIIPPVTPQPLPGMSPMLGINASLNLSAYVGPLPPPDTLAQYDKILPGAAERILRMAEEQSAHRRELETTIVDKNNFYQGLGIMAGLTVSCGVLIVAAYCISKGASLYGLAAVVALIAGLVYSFSHAKSEGSQNLAMKRDANSLPGQQPQPPLNTPPSPAR